MTVDTTLTTVNNSTLGSTGLPVISSAITIAGNGHTITRDAGAVAFRLIAINSSGDLTLQDTTLSGGIAMGASLSHSGGGILNSYGQLRLEGCTVSGNSGLAGGGVWSRTDGSDAVSLVNSTVSGNVAAFGGGVLSFTYDTSTLSLVNSTVVSGNAASGNGGGVYSLTFDTSTVALHRNLIVGNTATGSGDEVLWINGGGSFLVDDANLFGHSGVSTAEALSGFSAGATDILATSDSTAPTALTAILDTTLANNGGPTLTHALVTGSPAIDASLADADCPATDQRGVTRPQGPACDIGAFEVASDADSDGIPDFSDNCPSDPNTDQADFDSDAQGDVCDPDDDNDGVVDGSDNCPTLVNVDQINTDGDGLGNACDPDDDNDGVADGGDNCPMAANADQANTDGDALGDVCDPDDDNDGVNDGSDNCPTMANADQADLDGDALGDACDPDDDNDGVADGTDNCPLVANPNQEDTDHDGVGDTCDPQEEVCGNCLDDDGDGKIDLADEDCGALPLSSEKGTFGFKVDPDEDQLTLSATFPLGPVFDPPAEGVTVQFFDAVGQLACVQIPAGPVVRKPPGWKVKTGKTGTTWSFSDAKDGSLGDLTKDKLSVQCNTRKNVCTVKLNVKEANIAGDATARDITTGVIIGDDGWEKEQGWQRKAKGKKLVTP